MRGLGEEKNSHSQQWTARVHGQDVVQQMRIRGFEPNLAFNEKLQMHILRPWVSYTIFSPYVIFNSLYDTRLNNHHGPSQPQKSLRGFLTLIHPGIIGIGTSRDNFQPMDRPLTIEKRHIRTGLPELRDISMAGTR